MDTLDRRIIFFFSGSAVTGHSTGMYRYYLRRHNTSGTPENIFVGNFYYNGSDTSITLDMTDIIKSDGFVAKEDDFEGVYSMNTNLMSQYSLQIVWDTNDISTSSAQWVGKFYRYQNKNLNPFDSWIIAAPDNYLVNKCVIPMYQGFVPNTSSYNNGEFVLLPHYPMYSDDQAQTDNNCPFGLSLKFGSNTSSSILAFEVGNERFDGIYTEGESDTITKNGASTAYISNVGNAAYWRSSLIPTSDGSLYLTDRQYVIDATSGGWDDLAPAEYGDASPFCFVRYPSLDRSGTYRYAFVYVNNSKGMSCDEVTPDMLQSLDTSFVVYAKTQYPTVGSTDERSMIRPANNDVEYIVGDDAVWISRYTYKVGVLDVCPKRYYLFWQDRYGSFQCQAFNERAKYTESFDRTESQDYQNRRRNTNIQVQSKWRLNSGWIIEDLYPYYESIYTSPLLILFDVEQNERFTVLVSGDYEEKTYKNQKKLINMNLELTENKKQEFVY